jgi:predicted transcriptional regulator
MLGWSQHDLAAESGISYPTIARIEATDGALQARRSTVTKVRDTFEKAGIIFLAENGDGPGVRLRK